MTALEVVSPGPLTTIQDLGRPGWAHIGVPRSGAADRQALRTANNLVGNHPGAAALETTLVGPKLRFDGPTVIALTGAAVNATLGGVPVPMYTSVDVAAGELLIVGTATAGLRTYIALRGGILAPETLGSAATDLLTGLGPARVARGDVLTLGDAKPLASTSVSPPADRGPAPVGPGPVGPGPINPAPTLQVVLGPREDWFTPEAIERLTSATFSVSPASNRIGVRLDGPALERARKDELRSEGIALGSIQVPHDGYPILLLADHPTTGGYPVIAVLRDSELSAAAQLRPGQQVRFTAVSRDG